LVWLTRTPENGRRSLPPTAAHGAPEGVRVVNQATMAKTTMMTMAGTTPKSSPVPSSRKPVPSCSLPTGWERLAAVDEASQAACRNMPSVAMKGATLTMMMKPLTAPRKVPAASEMTSTIQVCG
jgi:hypothetical protein